MKLLLMCRFSIYFIAIVIFVKIPVLPLNAVLIRVLKVIKLNRIKTKLILCWGYGANDAARAEIVEKQHHCALYPAPGEIMAPQDNLGMGGSNLCVGCVVFRLSITESQHISISQDEWSLGSAALLEDFKLRPIYEWLPPYLDQL